MSSEVQFHTFLIWVLFFVIGCESCCNTFSAKCYTFNWWCPGAFPIVCTTWLLSTFFRPSRQHCLVSEFVDIHSAWELIILFSRDTVNELTNWMYNPICPLCPLLTLKYWFLFKQCFDFNIPSHVLNSHVPQSISIFLSPAPLRNACFSSIGINAISWQCHGISYLQLSVYKTYHKSYLLNQLLLICLCTIPLT